jgi:transposase
MKDDVNIAPILSVRLQATVRKSGRPRVIPLESESVVAELYRLGYGYQDIVRILMSHYHLNSDYSAVKRTLKQLGIPLHQD